MGKDKESEAELPINSLLFHCFRQPRCQSKSHDLESHRLLNWLMGRPGGWLARRLSAVKLIKNKSIEI